MTSSFTSLFCKTAGCPTTHTLLAFRRADIGPADQAFIESHLASCDICGAELQLLSRYRIEAEEYSFVEMPVPLRQLAEALLKRSTTSFKGLVGLPEHH